MQLDFGFDLRGNHRNRKHIGEIFSQVCRVNALDLSTSDFSERAERIEVALVTLYGDNTDSYASSASDLTDTLIECLGSLSVSLCVALIPGTEANVCETVRADDDG